MHKHLRKSVAACCPVFFFLLIMISENAFYTANYDLVKMCCNVEKNPTINCVYMAFAQGILCLYNVNGDHSSVMKQRKGDG